jgi:NAD(P)H-hydrate epimerase
MKILPVEMIREADAYTILHEPVPDLDLMERAATTCADWIKSHFSTMIHFRVFCGNGNNGGDGLVIARLLANAGFNVAVFCVGEPAQMSPSCRANFIRLQEESGIKPEIIPTNLAFNPHTELLSWQPEDVIIDALFGSGLTRPVSGVYADIIEYMNKQSSRVLAIDVPSGLFCDVPLHTSPKPVVVKADFTLSFAPAKLSFLFPENAQYTGEWILNDIGLHPEYLENAKVSNFLTQQEDVASILRVRKRFEHKGDFGHALLIGGSAGKMGAVSLAARACIRSGPGLVTAVIPASGINTLQSYVPEVMISPGRNQDFADHLPDLAPYKAIGIGPGLGTSPESAAMLKLLIQQTPVPVVFDADAINILSENKTWLGFLPFGSIFTPHPKEFERLAGKSSNSFERNKLQREFSAKFGCYVVLKGAFTAITTPGGDCWFNPTGNPGMATGGSGDVLTGIITGLLAQGYAPFQAALAGVFLHGLAGDLAAENIGYESLIASDIIDHLGNSFKTLYGKF